MYARDVQLKMGFARRESKTVGREFSCPGATTTLEAGDPPAEDRSLSRFQQFLLCASRWLGVAHITETLILAGSCLHRHMCL